MIYLFEYHSWIRKYSNRDNGKLNERSKLLEEEEIEKEPKIDIEKTKKSN
jgi:hypothetical protein